MLPKIEQRNAESSISLKYLRDAESIRRDHQIGISTLEDSSGWGRGGCSFRFDNSQWWLSGKESTCKAEDPGSVPGSERSSREGHSNPLQYSCLENPMDRGAWQAWGCKESDRTEQLTHTQAATQAAAEKKENVKGHFKAESLILRIHRKIFPGDSHSYLTELWVRLEFLKLWEQMWRNIILLLFCEQILPPGMVWETWVIATRIIYFPWEVSHPSYEDCFTLKMNDWQAYRIPLPELY